MVVKATGKCHHFGKTNTGYPALNSNGPVCEGDDVILSAPSNPGWVYEWTNDAGDVVGNDANSFACRCITITKRYVYTKGREEAGCPAVPAQISVTINAKPNAPAIVNNGPVL